MLNELDILRDVSERLEGVGIAFMLTGSMAMNYYAEPRMTRDIDLVVELERSMAPTLLDIFSPDYYIAEEAVAEALRFRSMFNIIHSRSVIKVDFVVRKDSPFRRQEFRRRRRIDVDGFSTWIVSREDLILSKMEWMVAAFGSEIQRRDILNLLDGEYDQEYLRRWAEELNLTPQLDELLDERHD